MVFISRQLGHASPSFTLDVYGGQFDRAEHARRAIDHLEATFGEILRPSVVRRAGSVNSSMSDQREETS